MPLPMKDEWSRTEARVDRALKLVTELGKRVHAGSPIPHETLLDRLEEIRAILAGEQ